MFHHGIGYSSEATARHLPHRHYCFAFCWRSDDSVCLRAVGIWKPVLELDAAALELDAAALELLDPPHTL